MYIHHFLEILGCSSPCLKPPCGPQCKRSLSVNRCFLGKEVNSKSCLKMRKCTGYNSVVIRWLPFFGVDISLSSANQRICKPLTPQTFRFAGSLAWISGESCLVDLTACPGTQDRLSVRKRRVPVPAAHLPALWPNCVKGVLSTSPNQG